MDAKTATQLLIQSTGLKKLWIYLTILSLMLNFMLGLAILLKKDTHRETFVPPFIQDEFWVDDNKVSDSYLRGMSLYLMTLAFNWTPKNAQTSADELLNHVSPSLYGSMKVSLQNSIIRLKKDDISTWFSPLRIETNDMRVIVTGNFNTALSSRMLNSETRIYELKFIREGSSTKLSSISQLDLNPLLVEDKKISDLSDEELKSYKIKPKPEDIKE